MLIAIAFTVLLLLVKDNMDVVWGILGNILSILSPFFLGFMIAYILNFPYKFFYGKAFKKMGSKHKIWLNFKKPLSVICTYIIFFAVIAALIGIVVPQIAANLSTLYENMPKYMQTGYNYIDQLFKFLNTHLHTNFSLDATVTELQTRLTKFLMSLDFSTTADATKNVLGIVGNILTNTASGLYNFLMAIIISIYFLASKDQLCRLVKRLAVAFIPMKFLPRVYEIVDVTDTKCGRFLVGDILDAGLIGILTYIVMSIFHLPYAPMIAVLVGVTNIIPFFGPFLGGIPSALILFLVDPIYAFWFVVILDSFPRRPDLRVLVCSDPHCDPAAGRQYFQAEDHWQPARHLELLGTVQRNRRRRAFWIAGLHSRYPDLCRYLHSYRQACPQPH